MKEFHPIPFKVHKPKRHEREITSKPVGYKPRLRKLNYRREAKPIAHKRTFFVQKKAPVPKSPFKYKYKPDISINWRFIFLLLLLMALVGGFVLLLMYLIRH